MKYGLIGVVERLRGCGRFNGCHEKLALCVFILRTYFLDVKDSLDPSEIKNQGVLRGF